MSIDWRMYTLVARAGIRVVILDQARRRVGIEVFEQCIVSDVDLLALDEGGYRHHDRELLYRALEVVGHRDDRAIAVAHEHHLRGLVVQAGVGRAT